MKRMGALLLVACSSRAPIAMDGGTDAQDVVAITRTMTTLASQQDHPERIRVDGANVVWASKDGFGGISKCPLDGGTVTRLVQTQDMYIVGLELSGQGFVWAGTGDTIPATNGSVATCALSGCGAPKMLASMLSDVSGVAVINGDAFWSLEGGSIRKCALSGCASPATVASNLPKPAALTADDTNLYWWDAMANTIVTCVAASCTPTVVTSTQDNVRDLTVAKGTLYWISTLGVVTCSRNGCGEPARIAGSGDVAGIAVDESSVYWTEYTSGNVMKCALDGCQSPTVLASGLKELPSGITVDATSVYWTSSWGDKMGGTITKLTPK